ncbi:hypothetical protein JCM19241_5029 [Vibrio ishigakensis]|uniref:Uncharacterized protein n=1 Tax=Vibrio ishigakensis TaxID=1481914 RepID=A0A0B8QFA6_9VIBR|nr:hypothetical protein JCM19241_5029 [Vibrio ishigakensis]
MHTELKLKLDTFAQLNSNVSWDILTRPNSVWVLALLSFLFEKKPRIQREEFYAEVKKHLNKMAKVYESIQADHIYYINDWLNHGYLATYQYKQGLGDGEYEIGFTREAQLAVDFVQSLNNKDILLNDSYMQLLMSQVHKLNITTSEDRRERLRDLENQQRQIKRQIEALETGDIEVVDNEKAVRDFKTIILLLGSLDSDFIQVSNDVRDVNSEIIKKVIKLAEGQSKGTILDFTFDSLDELYSKASGRSFVSFWEMMKNSRLQSQFENDIESLLSRPFITEVPLEERKVLQNLSRRLMTKCLSVSNETSVVSKTLSSFVRYHQDTTVFALNQKIKEAMSSFISLKDDYSIKDELLEVTLPKLEKRQINTVELYMDPSRFPEPDYSNPAMTLQEAKSLIPETDINWRRLIFTINASLANNSDKKIGIKLSDITERYPIEFGLASLIGYLVLGDKYGIIDTSVFERIPYKFIPIDSDVQIRKYALIPQIYFTKTITKQVDEVY